MKNQVFDQSRASERVAFDASVKPFRIEIPQAQLEDLSDRLARASEPSNVGPAASNDVRLAPLFLRLRQSLRSGAARLLPQASLKSTLPKKQLGRI